MPRLPQPEATVGAGRLEDVSVRLQVEAQLTALRVRVIGRRAANAQPARPAQELRGDGFFRHSFSPRYTRRHHQQQVSVNVSACLSPNVAKEASGEIGKKSNDEFAGLSSAFWASASGHCFAGPSPCSA